MARSLALFALLSISGCVGAHVPGVGIDVDGDGHADPIPPGRGGPWLDCQRALDDATVGDVCDFDTGCARRDAFDTLHTMVCSDHRIVPGLESTVPPPTCDDDLVVAGACVEIPEYAGECDAAGSGRRFRVCVADPQSPPDDGIPSAPWALTDASVCATLVAGHAENGDACTGTFVCDGGALYSGGHGPAIAWCDAGTLRYVVPMQSIR